jgi:hypothetical protein
MAERNRAAENLSFADQLRSRTRTARGGHWFALVVFGMVVLASMPFYLTVIPTARTPGCRSDGPHSLVCTAASRRDVLGAGLGSGFGPAGLARWETAYWSIATLIAFGLIVYYHRRRALARGVQARLWPFVVAGAVLVAFAVASGGSSTFAQVPDFWLRGTQALVVIAVGIAVLALVERSRPLGLFALVFFALAVLSCLYDVVNLFSRIGLGGPFDGGASQLPNLIVPGLFLVLGGCGFWLRGRRDSVAR